MKTHNIIFHYLIPDIRLSVPLSLIQFVLHRVDEKNVAYCLPDALIIICRMYHVSKKLHKTKILLIFEICICKWRQEMISIEHPRCLNYWCVRFQLLTEIQDYRWVGKLVIFSLRYAKCEHHLYILLKYKGYGDARHKYCQR